MSLFGLMNILLKNSPSLSSQSLFCCSAMFSLFISNKSAVDFLSVLKRWKILLHFVLNWFILLRYLILPADGVH